MCADVKEYTTYDGVEKRKVVNPMIKSIKFDGGSLGKMKFHVDFDLLVAPTTDNLDLIQKAAEAIENIELDVN